MNNDLTNKISGITVMILVKVESFNLKLYLNTTAKTKEDAQIPKSKRNINHLGILELITNSRRKYFIEKIEFYKVVGQCLFKILFW
ncbi:MAG: hypothetical protein ACOVSR_09590 [Bacteroidia bacterium]